MRERIKSLSEEIHNSGEVFIVKEKFSNDTFVITASSKDMDLKKSYKFQNKELPSKKYEDYIKNYEPTVKKDNSRGGVIRIVQYD
jgi:hypothetical protein